MCSQILTTAVGYSLINILVTEQNVYIYIKKMVHACDLIMRNIWVRETPLRAKVGKDQSRAEILS